MDKETLSNYGWIVICVLVLAVMIALAGPFGNFVADAVKSTTQGLFDTNQKALQSANINIMQQEFENMLSDKDPALNPSGTIPDGAHYGNINTETGVVTWYTEMPTTVSVGNIYFYGDYTYLYIDGWVVMLATEDLGICPTGFELTDKEQMTYGAILESINGVPVTDMSQTFKNCESLKTAPAIPSNVTSLSHTFTFCRSLENAPVIPSNVTNMTWAFGYCTSLKTAPTIPNSVTTMLGAFGYCTSLTSKPIIPSSVTTPESDIFQGCTQFGY